MRSPPSYSGPHPATDPTGGKNPRHLSPMPDNSDDPSEPQASLWGQQRLPLGQQHVLTSVARCRQEHAGDSRLDGETWKVAA